MYLPSSPLISAQRAWSNICAPASDRNWDVRAAAVKGLRPTAAHVVVRDRLQIGESTNRLILPGIDDNDIQALLKQTAEKAPRPWLRPIMVFLIQRTIDWQGLGARLQP